VSGDRSGVPRADRRPGAAVGTDRDDLLLAATGGPAFGVDGILFAMQVITSRRKKAKRA